MNYKSAFLCWLMLLLSGHWKLMAQTIETGGWLFLSHQQKLNSKIDLLSDVQFRTSDQYRYLNTVLIRNAMSYNIDKKHSIGLGYAYKADWEKQADRKDYTLEHRLFEQYNFETSMKQIELALRARLEQRFVKDASFRFSQRARAFVSARIPVLADGAFSTGLYIKLQNELFLNVVHKNHVNGHVLDQNRPLAALGYRFNEHADIDLGYMRWFQREDDGNFRRNILQFTISTNL